MNTSRRLFALGLVGATVVCTSAHAWGWGSKSERLTGNGDLATEMRDASGFDSIVLSGGFNLRIRQGTGGKIEVKADRNLLPYIETQLDGRTLRIQPRKGFNLQSQTTPSFTIEMPAVRKLAVAGAGAIKVEAMKTGSVEAAVAGSGDIHFANLDAEALALKISGTGDIVAAGRAATASVTIAGSGDVKAAELVADEVKVSIAGSGDARVHAARRLNVSIAGSGDVRYHGSPEISSSIAGSGSVTRIDK